MTNTCPLSTDAKNYLCCFYQILDEMTHGITTAGLTQSISHNFIVQMIPHHRAAVRMSDNILRFSDNQAVRRLAQRIAEEQTQDIADMEAILSICAQQTNPQLDLRLYQRRMDLIFREMFAPMGSAPENNRLSAVYLQEMIPHHRGAVRMAENTLKYDVCLELVPLLRQTVRRQCRQIGQMQALLGRMSCQGTNRIRCQAT